MSNLKIFQNKYLIIFLHQMEKQKVKVKIEKKKNFRRLRENHRQLRLHHPRQLYDELVAGFASSSG